MFPETIQINTQTWMHVTSKKVQDKSVISDIPLYVSTKTLWWNAPCKLSILVELHMSQADQQGLVEQDLIRSPVFFTLFYSSTGALFPWV